MMMTKWNVEALTGYTPITTFWEDFCIAEHFGMSAIRDTYRRAFKAWKDNYKYITELAMVLNHKSWYFYDAGNAAVSQLYVDLYYKLDEWILENLKGEELDYYYRVTD